MVAITLLYLGLQEIMDAGNYNDKGAIGGL